MQSFPSLALSARPEVEWGEKEIDKVRKRERHRQTDRERKSRSSLHVQSGAEASNSLFLSASICHNWRIVASSQVLPMRNSLRAAAAAAEAFRPVGRLIFHLAKHSLGILISALAANCT